MLKWRLLAFVIKELRENLAADGVLRSRLQSHRPDTDLICHACSRGLG